MEPMGKVIASSDSPSGKTVNMPEPQTSKKQPSSSNMLEQRLQESFERLQESFEQLGYLQLQALQYSVEDGVLRMSGELDSFYLKQVAQSVAIRLVGSESVLNLIEVK